MAGSFKKYVHGRLDEMGVPHDADPEQTTMTGCRIGGRLDWLERLLRKLDWLEKLLGKGIISREWGKASPGVPDNLAAVEAAREAHYRGVLNKHVGGVLAEINAEREEILKAFVAKYGVEDPARVEQITETHPDGSTTWGVRIRPDAIGGDVWQCDGCGTLVRAVGRPPANCPECTLVADWHSWPCKPGSVYRRAIAEPKGLKMLGVLVLGGMLWQCDDCGVLIQGPTPPQTCPECGVIASWRPFALKPGSSFRRITPVEPRPTMEYVRTFEGDVLLRRPEVPENIAHIFPWLERAIVIASEIYERYGGKEHSGVFSLERALIALRARNSSADRHKVADYARVDPEHLTKVEPPAPLSPEARVELAIDEWRRTGIIDLTFPPRTKYDELLLEAARKVGVLR